MVETAEIVVFIVSGIAAILACIVGILIFILCRIVYVRRRRKKHQISTNRSSSQGTALTTLTTNMSTTDKRYVSAFSTSVGGRDANSIVKSDTSTTSSNHIRVSDGSASSGNSTKAEIVMAQQATDTLPAKQLDATNPLPISRDNVSADYDEIEEDKTEEKQKGGTIQSAADSTLSTVSSFNSSMRDSALDGTLLYDDENQNSFLDTLEPGAHNTPRFPIAASNYNHLALKADYEKDPNYVQDHDYEKDPDYQQKKRFDPPMPPAHLYQGLLNRPGSKEIHYKSPEKSLRPLSEKLPRLLEHDYADTIPHCNSLSTQQAQHNYDYTKLRASTLDPLPHYTHLDIKTKENQRGSGLSYVTTDL